MHLYFASKSFYDVEALWKESDVIPSKLLSTVAYFDHLFEPSWDDGLRPMEVLLTQKSEHYQRCLKCNLEYDILIDPENHIIDGRHRLAKHFLKKSTYFKAKVFNTWEEMRNGLVNPYCPQCNTLCFLSTLNPDSFTCKDMGHWVGDVDEVKWKSKVLV